MANRLQRGQAGEMAAEYWFKRNGWKMERTQPPVTILGMISGTMLPSLKRFIPRLACFGHMVIARMGKGGIADYTGYSYYREGDMIYTLYRACEVKEATGDTMPASRLDKEQRKFMDALPENCAYVGVLWGNSTFEMFPYVSKGSYKRGEGTK